MGLEGHLGRAVLRIEKVWRLRIRTDAHDERWLVEIDAVNLETEKVNFFWS